MPNATVSSTIDPNGPEALLRAQEAAARIKTKELIPARIDVTQATTRAIGCVPALLGIRDSVVALFGEAGAAAIDDVVPAARAAAFAQADYAIVAGRDLEPGAKALMETCTRLHNIADALVKRGLVDARGLEGLMGGQSYGSLCHDVLALAAWFKRHAVALAPHSKITADERLAAEREAEEFRRMVGERDQAIAGTTPEAQVRNRAFTYFVRTYDVARKFVTYARWHEGDADAIVPSLYAGRDRTARTDTQPPAVTEPVATPPVTSTPASPTPVVASPVVASPVVPSPAVASPAASVAPTTPTNPIPPGMPGADPFIRNT